MDDEKRMPISEHLVELRSRIIVCLIGTLLGTILAYVYVPDVLCPILYAPLDAIQGNDATNPFVLKHRLLQIAAEQYQAEVKKRSAGAPPPGQVAPNRLRFTGLPVAFIIRLKIALVVGILLALPLIAYEIWAFVSAGLHANERKYVLIYAPVSFALFIAGVLLAYFFVLPLGAVFLLLQGVEMGLEPLLTIDEFAPFVLWLMFGFGLVFQMPLIVLFLTMIGVVKPEMLTRSRRVAILVIFIVAAVLTPPDVFTQIAMAVPMMGLYELSILLSKIAARRKSRTI